MTELERDEVDYYSCQPKFTKTGGSRLCTP